MPRGAEAESDDALLDAAGRESVVATGNGGAVEPSGGGFTAESGSPTSSPGGGEGGRPASETSGAGAAGQPEPFGQAGAGGANGAAGQSAAPGDTSAAGMSAAGGSGEPADDTGGARQPVIGDPAKGHQILILDNCYRCHGDNLAGRSFYPNITPDIETGIGAWTDRQISTAIRGAVGPDGELFCAVMPLYSGFKPQQIADLIAFLRIVPAVHNSIVAVCPGHNP